MRLVDFNTCAAYPLVEHDQIKNIFSQYFEQFEPIVLNKLNNLFGNGLVIVNSNRFICQKGFLRNISLNLNVYDNILFIGFFFRIKTDKSAQQ